MTRDEMARRGVGGETTDEERTGNGREEEMWKAQGRNAAE